MQQNNLAAFAHTGQHALLIVRQQRSEVNDLNRGAFLGQHVRRLQRCPYHSSVGDDGNVAAFPANGRLAQRHNKVFCGHIFLDPPVKVFVLVKNDGIIVADGCLDQAFGVERRGGSHDFQPRYVRKPHFIRLRMKRPAVYASPRRTSDHHRHGGTPAVVDLCRHVDNLVKPTGDEIHKLHLRHRTHPHQGRADGSAYDGRFGDGRVNHAVLAELFQHSSGHIERAAVSANILAQEKNGGVTLHLLPDALSNCFKVSQVRHGFARLFHGRVFPPALGVAIHAFQCVWAFRERTCFSEGDCVINMLSDICIEVVNLLSCQNLFGQQKFFQLHNGIFLPPFCEQLLGHVFRSVVRGMARHPESLAFNEAGTVPRASSLEGFLDRGINRQYVVAVHFDAWHAVSCSAHGKVLDCVLLFDRSRIGIGVVVADEDDRKLHDGGHIHGLVDIAPAGGPFPEVDECNIPPFAPLQNHAHTAGNRARIAKVRDDGNNAPAHVTDVESVVTSSAWSVASRHPVAENLPQRKTTDEERREIPVAGQHNVAVHKLDRGADSDSFLASADVDTTNDFSLAVKDLFNPRLGFACKLQIIEHSLQQLSARGGDLLAFG